MKALGIEAFEYLEKLKAVAGEAECSRNKFV